MSDAGIICILVVGCRELQAELCIIQMQMTSKRRVNFVIVLNRLESRNTTSKKKI